MANMSIGDAIKQARGQKGYSLSELGGGIVSTSGLSRLENNLTKQVSVDSLISMLERLNMSYDEFQTLRGNQKFLLKQEINNLLYKGVLPLQSNILELALEKVQQGKQLSNELFFLHKEQVIEAMLMWEENEELAKQKIAPVIRYLFDVKKLGVYEIHLITCIMPMLPADDVLSYGSKAIAAIEEKPLLFTSDRLSSLLCLQASVVLLKEGPSQLFPVLRFLQAGLEFATHSYAAVHILVARILQQIVYFKQNNILFEEKQLEQLLRSLELTGFHSELEFMQELIKTHKIPFV